MANERFLDTWLGFRVDRETKQQIKELAKAKGYPLGLFLREMIRRELSINQSITNSQKSY